MKVEWYWTVWAFGFLRRERTFERSGLTHRAMLWFFYFGPFRLLNVELNLWRPFAEQEKE